MNTIEFYNKSKKDIDEYIMAELKDKQVKEIVETYIYPHFGMFTRDHVTHHVDIDNATVEELLSNKIAFCAILKFFLRNRITNKKGLDNPVEEATEAIMHIDFSDKPLQ